MIRRVLFVVLVSVCFLAISGSVRAECKKWCESSCETLPGGGEICSMYCCEEGGDISATSLLFKGDQVKSATDDLIFKASAYNVLVDGDNIRVIPKSKLKSVVNSMPVSKTPLR